MLARVWAPMEITTKIVETVLYIYARYFSGIFMPADLDSNLLEFGEQTPSNSQIMDSQIGMLSAANQKGEGLSVPQSLGQGNEVQ